MDDKSSLKGAWSGHVNHLNFDVLMGNNHMSKMAEAIVIKFCTQIGYVKCQSRRAACTIN